MYAGIFFYFKIYKNILTFASAKDYGMYGIYAFASFIIVSITSIVFNLNVLEIQSGFLATVVISARNHNLQGIN